MQDGDTGADGSAISILSHNGILSGTRMVARCGYRARRSLGPASTDELAAVALGVGPEGEELKAVWTGLEGSCTAGGNPQCMPRTQLHDLALHNRASPTRDDDVDLFVMCVTMTGVCADAQLECCRLRPVRSHASG